MFQSILVPVDILDPDIAEAAFARALALARPGKARITAVSVVPAWPDDLARLPQDHEPRLQDWVDARRGAAAVSVMLKVGGSIAGRLQEAISEVGADLVVMASHNPRITDYLIGSNAAHLALHAPCSVLVCRGGAEAPWRHILVPVDPARPEVANRAMALAQGFASEAGARLTAIAIAPMIDEGTGAGAADHQATLDRWVEGLEGTPKPEAELRIAGSVSGEIRYVAQESGVDLIVMASHDPRASDYLIGSNAAHVALHTDSSVMVVR